MKKTFAMLAAVATAATAVPATLAIPQAANAQVSVAVGTPGAAFVYNGRNYRHRSWRNGAWFYYDPIVVAPAYDSYGYAPGYDYGPSAGVYYYNGRHYKNRHYDCHWNPNRGRVCKYRYW